MAIIPYQELLGNYDKSDDVLESIEIIPYQELLGNYDSVAAAATGRSIIPYQELLGNYDEKNIIVQNFLNYTIPRAIREL